MPMLFTQNYATSTAVVAVAALATMIMSALDLPTGTRLGAVVAVSVVTMFAGNVWATVHRDPLRWDSSLWDDDAS